jgi:hypothetical protein
MTEQAGQFVVPKMTSVLPFSRISYASMNNFTPRQSHLWRTFRRSEHYSCDALRDRRIHCCVTAALQEHVFG